MPLYEFQCVKCNAIHEKLAKHDCASLPCDTEGCDGICGKTASVPSGLIFEKKFYPNGKDWNETRREKWEKPRSWQQE